MKIFSVYTLESFKKQSGTSKTAWASFPARKYGPHHSKCLVSGPVQALENPHIAGLFHAYCSPHIPETWAGPRLWGTSLVLLLRLAIESLHFWACLMKPHPTGCQGLRAGTAPCDHSGTQTGPLGSSKRAGWGVKRVKLRMKPVLPALALGTQVPLVIHLENMDGKPCLPQGHERIKQWIL